MSGTGPKLGVPTLAKALKGTAARPAPATDAVLPPDQVPPDVLAEAQTAAPEFAPEGAKVISPEDVPDDIARQAMSPEQYGEHKKQVEYGVGVGNMVRTAAESAARAMTLGLSDVALQGLGADTEGLRERQARNEISADVGTAIVIIAPALLTGGASSVEMGLGRALAEATPIGLVSRAGAAASKAVELAGGTSLVARVAAHATRGAVEGAIFGASSTFSGRVLNGEDVWDPQTAGEYLAAAGQGAMLGVGLGAGASLVGEGLSAAKGAVAGLGRRVAGAVNAPIEAAQAELSAAQSADYGSKLRAAQIRQASLTAEQFGPELPAMRAQAAAQWEKATANAAELPESGVPKVAMRADAPLEQIHASISKEAQALGVDKAATRSAWDRLVQGREALANADMDHAATARRMVAIGDELELRSANALDEISLSKRNDAVRKALTLDTTAAPPSQIIEAFGKQVQHVQNTLAEFLDDADPQIKSYAKKLNALVASAATDMDSYAQSGKLAGMRLDAPRAKAAAADAYETLDQMNRVLGRVRAKLGERSALGIGTLSEKLTGLYEDSRQLLKNPNIIGDQAAAIGARAKAAWTDVFDSGSGYRKALIATNAGGERLASGFETADRFDPAKLSKWLRTINEPESQLQLELVARHLDAQSKLMQTFSEDLAPGKGAAANIAAHKDLSKRLVDEILGYRSRAGLAAEYAQSVAPAVKEAEALEGKIAAAQAKSEARLASERLRAEELVTKEAGRADELKAAAVAKAQSGVEAAQDKVSVGIARTALQGVGVALGGHFGGGLGALAGEALGSSFTTLTTPIVRAMARSGLESAIRTDGTMRVAAAASKAAMRIRAATDAIGQAMHGGAVTRAATAVAIESGSLQERYQRAKKAVESAGPAQALNDSTPMTSASMAQTQQRAQQFLQASMPKDHAPLGIRSDLDKLAAPQRIEMRRWLRQVEAVKDPAAVLHAVARGEQDPAQLAAVRAVYPKMLEAVAADIQAHAEKLTKQPPMSVAVAVGHLLDMPMHFTQTPEFARFTQTAYQQQAQQQQTPRARGVPKPTGAQRSATERAEAM